ncbi:uncharacterized protein LOC110117528 [Ceratitis capitata]|uniref:uncharacterized protein LOC110117528 n=1 Tax=Ceratitis capitata TaxID=7213 RepID=UPI000A1100EB|nr:uncharacterized protein LOC110117528 [Ceratitis capitata]
MGSSSASITDGNINTSTDSASTLVTSITHTDTSETCDSLDLGDNSGQSEPLFSSLEEPLLTAIQIDSEHENGTELELTSCNMYNRPDMNVQDSTESQESSLSILTIEPSSTTPLLASHRRQNSSKCGTSAPPAAKLSKNTGIVSANTKERLPNTAPAPSSGTKHFTFDPPISPKSARTSEKSRTHFSFKEQQAHQAMHQTRRGSNWEDQRTNTTNFMEERSPTSGGGRRDNSPNRSKYRAYAAQRHAAAAAAAQAYYEQHQLADDEESLEGTRSKKLRSRETSGSARQRHPPGNSGNATSPKREQRRSPSSSAPPTMKEGHFFASSGGKPKQLSPASQQRKYSSSSSSGGSERGRERTKDSTMFPFDREAIDYERIQRECFAVDENSSSTTTSSDSDDAEPCSVYERKMSAHHISSNKTGEVFQQYKILAQHEQVPPPIEIQSNGPSSRKNSKRIRPSSVIHATIRESQPYVPQTDAFYPQKVKQQSPGEYAPIGGVGGGGGVGSRQHSPKSFAELNKFEEIASKFEQIPPKQQPQVGKTAGGSPSGSNNNMLIGSALQATNSGNSNNNGTGSGMADTVAPTSSPTGSMRGTISPPLPNLRVDFFAESQMMHPRKRSSKKKQVTAKTGLTNATHDILDESQRCVGGMLLSAGAGAGGAGPINVTSNPMDVAVCTPPRATIVVQQVSTKTPTFYKYKCE